MSNWRDLAANGRFDEITWQHLSAGDRRDYLEILRQAVPSVEDCDGMEHRERFRHPDEINDPRLRAAALDLLLGELAMSVEGDIADQDPSIREWRDLRAEVRDALSTQAGSGGSSENDLAGSLTLEAHATRGLEHLHGLEVLFGHYLSEERKAGDHGDEAYMNAALSECALLAYALGASVRATWSKPFEPHAAVRIKQQQASAPKVAEQNAIRREAARTWHEEARRQAAEVWTRSPKLSSNDVAKRIHRDFQKRCRNLDASLSPRNGEVELEDQKLDRRKLLALTSPFLTRDGAVPSVRTIRKQIAEARPKA